MNLRLVAVAVICGSIAAAWFPGVVAGFVYLLGERLVGE